MENIYPMLIAFLFVFVSELGDKTQILVMTFSAKQKIATIMTAVGGVGVFVYLITAFFPNISSKIPWINLSFSNLIPFGISVSP